MSCANCGHVHQVGPTYCGASPDCSCTNYVPGIVTKVEDNRPNRPLPTDICGNRSCSHLSSDHEQLDSDGYRFCMKCSCTRFDESKRVSQSVPDKVKVEALSTTTICGNPSCGHWLYYHTGMGQKLCTHCECQKFVEPTDMVNHPPHYTKHPSGVECITITEHMSFNVGNAVKYLWRADDKGAPLVDLEKAAWYIKREIEKRKRDARNESDG